MKRFTFEEMAFSRASDAWCPISGRSFGPNNPRVQPDRILASVGSIPIYHRFSELQGYVKYSNEVGCYERVGETTHVFTDELDALETLLTAQVPSFSRGPCGLGLSQDGRPLEVFSILNDYPEYFLIDTLIHGNEPDGILGTLKAFEVIATHPDFAPLRGMYEIVLMPCCNPDGYYIGQRNLDLLGPHPSGTPTGINLNRVWPWFWDEFIPTSGESKGDAPITCCLEATAMEAWRSGGTLRSIAWALDQHATAGDGARYASRDRCFRGLDEDEYEKLWSDWTVYRLLKSVQARRVHEGPNPDLWVNMYRSRWRPHWHSYLSTLSLDQNGGIPCCSFVGEHNKVPSQVVTADLETYKSASEFNFDHIIAMALVAQGGITERKAAVFVEHEVGQNQVLNSNFASWSSSGVYRPSYWNATRIDALESSRIDHHMKHDGRPVQATVDVLMEIIDPDYCPEDSGSDLVYQAGTTAAAMLLAYAPVGEVGLNPVLYTWDYSTSPELLTIVTGLSANIHRQWRLGYSDPLDKIFIFGTGIASSDSKANLYKIVLGGGVWVLSDLYLCTDAYEDAAVVLNNATGNLYIFGGTTFSGDSASVWIATHADDGFTEVGENLLTTGAHGMGGCFCSGGDLDGLIVLVGDQSDGELGLKVRIFNPGLETITDYLVDAPTEGDPFDGYPPSIYHCGVVYDGVDTVWIYGGEHPASGTVYWNALSITWNGTGFNEIEIHVMDAGLSDDGDPEDYAGDEVWSRRFRNWRALRTQDVETGAYSHSLFGGLERLPSGSDETDLSMRRGFYAHMLSINSFGRPSDYDFGYVNYNTHLDVSGWDKASATWSVRSGTVGTDSQSTAYSRLNLAPGDEGAGVLTTRRVRTYYMHPPQWWFRSQVSIDLTMAEPGVIEDQLRIYARAYRQGQEFWVDAPMVQVDTLWPSSWSPYGVTRAVEEASWPVALDPRWFRLQFDWLPAAPFMAMTTDVKLATISEEGGRFELWAITPTDNQREYNRGNVVGTSEPVIRLRRVLGGDTEDVDIPCYWGGYLRDIALDRFDSPLQIEIWNHSAYGSGLVVRNGWAEGWARIPVKTSIAAWPNAANITIHGGGWWGEPQMLKMDSVWRNKYAEQDFEQGALLIGDRDPTSGQVSSRGAFRYTESFARADSSNLGSNWYVIQQTGNGWNISSNQARCEELGWERWISYPYLRDCSILAEVKAPNGGKVGLFTRLHWGLAVDLFAHGYAGYLSCTGASTANLIIARYYKDGAGVQQVSVLATQAVTYNASTQVTLEFEASGSTLTLTMSGAHTGTVTTVDANHILPGGFGLFGETPGAGQYVWADNVRASVPASVKLHITD